ncbi:Holliday junction branch migration protein RuvA [Humibacter ginsenosidimutans]|uniref:Holliday junction branch migration complex subunit RuvA n=1 Tax=Humibacter ginsenosidimutans TaxID=2599293 RepID=A0A5B8LZB8_9MICO|nr:Holliday junction branch migration protein RuvA [Humibacter ginsenosidimutans]QDZ13858.1 Holliday junction branch migration protein RuvA [Humibacter ginsenosidimutans]
MISSLRGTVLQASDGVAVIDVGGVGYAVQVTPDHARSLRTGEEAIVYTSMIVRQESIALFGFPAREHLGVFDALIGVSGVGPKSALGVLAALSPDEIALAVASDDDSAFRKVSGIGPKTAKLIVVSLTGKLFAPARPVQNVAQIPRSDVSDSVVIALVGLGWAEKTATDVVRELVDEYAEPERDTVQALLRLALSRLGPTARQQA